MRMQRFSLLTLAGLLAVTGQMARAVDIYVTTNNQETAGAGTVNYGRINSATGAYTSLGDLSEQDVYNLTWNPAASNFYVTQGNLGGTNLRTMTTDGTLSSTIGVIGGILSAMTYRTANSTLYAFDYNNDATGTVSTSTGVFSTLNSSPGASAWGSGGGRYTILNDTMYMTYKPTSSATVGYFGTMGYTATSTFQQIGSSNANFANMALATDGTTLWGIHGNGVAGQQRLYTINPTNGALTLVGNITGAGVSTYFHGASTTVPEPSTYALAAIASGVLAFLARRRKARLA